MDITTSLYDGKLIRLGPIDHEKDPEIVSRWSHDIEYLRMIGESLPLPESPYRFKKKFEALEKAIDESKNKFYFTIRLRSEDAELNDRLLGFASLDWISWAHGYTFLRMGLGNPADRRKGYGSDALALILRFVFRELNLHRVSVNLGANNTAALAFFQKFGFVEEIRRRQAIHVDGQVWDALSLGLLHDEWQPVKQS